MLRISSSHLFRTLPSATRSRVQLMASQRAHTAFPHTHQAIVQNILHKLPQRGFASETGKKEEKAAVPSSTEVSVNADGTGAVTFSSLVQKYGGWYPLIGLGGFLAISKELLILNEEFLMVSNFAAFVFLLWFGAGDLVKNMIAEDAATTKAREDNLSDFHIEVLESMIQVHQLNIAQVDVLKELKAEYNALTQQVAKARDLKIRAAARAAVVSRLEAIKQREESERSAHSAAVFEKTSAFVKSEFVNLPKQQRDVLIEYAIGVLSGNTQPLDSKVDPVKKLYRDYLTSKQYEKDIEADKKAKSQK